MTLVPERHQVLTADPRSIGTRAGNIPPPRGRLDHGICECVDSLGRVRDRPLLVIRRQAMAEANAQIVEQLDDIRRPIVAPRRRPGPVVRRE